MLPDFPELKKAVLQDASAKIRKLIHEHHPVLAEIKALTQHEGRSMRYEQVGYGEKHEDLQHQSFPIEIRLDEVPTLFGDQLTLKLEGLARAVGEHQMKSFIAKHEEATEMTGNRIDGQGRPMDGRILLELIETMPADFDSNGDILSTNRFLTHPNMMPAYMAAIQEIENDPELQCRQQSINAKRYNDWVDRENRRKLVD